MKRQPEDTVRAVVFWLAAAVLALWACAMLGLLVVTLVGGVGGGGGVA